MSAIVFKYKKKKHTSIDFLSLFQELKELCFPAYKYKQGNCHNVVHYCSMVLSRRNIKHKKIWFYAPKRLDAKSKICISKPDPNGLALKGNLRWGYHVALLFEDGNNCHIFDLMINENKPITINDWVMNMGLSHYKIDIVDSENYLFYSRSEEEKSVQEGFSYFHYEGECRDNHWIPKGLAINETAYEFFLNEQAYLDVDSELSKDYKTLVGSIINFECVIRDYDFNKKATMQFQAKHFELIEKYRYIYLLKLSKWMGRLEYWDF
jgi:hypothetical protein